MFSFVNKYLKNNNNKPSGKEEKEEKEDREKKEETVKKKKSSADQNQNQNHHHQMMTMISRDGCGVQNQFDPSEGCCSGPNCLGLATISVATDHHHQSSSSSNYFFKRRTAATTITATTTTTMRICRSDFAKSTTSTLFPNTQFTNHESLPCFLDALSGFTQTYPQYKETQEADRIRQQHYSHLSDHVCLDYTGFTLFSHSQLLRQASSSSSTEPSQPPLPPFFGISYKTVSLTSQVQYGGYETARGLESAIKNRIMGFLNISPEDYTMVCTANRTSAFKLLVEAYPFHSNKSLITVYDYECEAVSAMADSAHKRGAKVMSANFSWPSLRIHSAKLKKILQNKNRKNNNHHPNKKKRGLFVFPLQSRMTGARYPYLWMRIAQENGWHVLLDACALGPKDLDTLGLSLIQPDFIICSFFKVVGENPSGFASVLVKKSSASPLLEASMMGKSIGIVSIVPAATNVLSQSQLSHEVADDLSGTFSVSDIHTVSSFSDPMPGTLICNGSESKNKNAAVGVQKGHQPRSSKQVESTRAAGRFEQGETSSSSSMAVATARDVDQEKMTSVSSEIVELEEERNGSCRTKAGINDVEIIECMGLDHADSLGLLLIRSRLRYITNWLVIALLKLRHPNSESGHSLVRIYGPMIKFERGPAIAFNVFDWKGEKVEPALVQKLADRSNISLSCGFLHNIWFSDKYQEERDAVVETTTTTTTTKRKEENIDVGIGVVNASLGFLTNFEDAYRLWSFIARFLDADFVEKERWRYMALNQKMIEV